MHGVFQLYSCHLPDTLTGYNNIWHKKSEQVVTYLDYAESEKEENLFADFFSSKGVGNI